MKLYAQHGFGNGDKIQTGLHEQSIQGAIMSPKDLKPDTMVKKMQELRDVHPTVDLLMDPLFYANLYAAEPNVKLGRLPDWDFFSGFRRNQLEEPGKIDTVLKSYLKSQVDLPVTGIIAPNIYISRSFDSIEAAIAKNFIRRTASIYDGERNDKRPVYASILVSREALLQKDEFNLFLNDITALGNPPDGFYVIVGARSSAARTDIFNADVIAAWMLMNHALNINALEVINGYSDTLTPFLGIAGGTAGATGWWSKLRMFGLDSLIPTTTGGRLPIIRYLSVLLMNRITHTEKDAFSAFIPEVLNALGHDDDYSPEPERSVEVLQSWESLRKLIDTLVTDDMEASLRAAEEALDRAENAYAYLKSQVAIDPKSNDEHLEAIRQGIAVFKQTAEI